MNKQKESLKDIKMYLAYNYFEDDFLKQKDLIDQNKKINILTYAMSYDKQTQIYNLGVFIVNSTETPINDLKLNVTPVYKTLDYREEIDLTLNDLIPPKGVVLQTFVGHLSVEQLDGLVQNKPADITFDINNLQIDGEEIKNNHQD